MIFSHVEENNVTSAVDLVAKLSTIVLMCLPRPISIAIHLVFSNSYSRIAGRIKSLTIVVAEATVNRTPDSHLLVAYLDLKAKLENLQSMVKQAATLIRPSLTSEAAVNAIDELELVALNASPPPNAQTQQQPQPEQVQPQS
ncbi:hypothetical protein SASPL_129193 [Salvia splendens]|uniref:Uncharacterized protein n=1 Tax=Salvia splendens TaxID=180675 RepID=A0A8X8ZP79_SALSN|nr:hypothetical protein SASPL_129193 [Salvia splendens]